VHAHLGFVTEYRHQVFSSRHLERVEQTMRDVRADFGAELREFNGEPEHAHLLVNFPPTAAISRLVNSLKGVPSGRLRQEFPRPASPLLAGQARWSGHYFAGSLADARITVLRRYIEQQTAYPDRPCPATSTTSLHGWRTGSYW
jgi:putative transposase